jgi:hypothetical protein
VCVSMLFTEPLFPECAPGCYVCCGCSSILIFTVEGVYPFVLSWSILFCVTRLVASCLVLVFFLVWLLVFCIVVNGLLSLCRFHFLQGWMASHSWVKWIVKRRSSP